jgi:hypothetical protein
MQHAGAAEGAGSSSQTQVELLWSAVQPPAAKDEEGEDGSDAGSSDQDSEEEEGLFSEGAMRAAQAGVASLVVLGSIPGSGIPAAAWPQDRLHVMGTAGGMAASLQYTARSQHRPAAALDALTLLTAAGRHAAAVPLSPAPPRVQAAAKAQSQQHPQPHLAAGPGAFTSLAQAAGAIACVLGPEASASESEHSAAGALREALRGAAVLTVHSPVDAQRSAAFR